MGRFHVARGVALRIIVNSDLQGNLYQSGYSFMKDDKDLRCVASRPEIERPDAISAPLTRPAWSCLSDTGKAVARACSGVNNIPLLEFSKHGVAVFDAQGANATAETELAS